MSKVLKNTTGSDIDLNVVGLTIPTLGQLIINVVDYALLGESDSVLELVPYLNSGDLIVNDGAIDLNVTDGLSLIQSSYAKPVDSLILNDRIKVDIGDSLIIGPQGPQGDAGPQGPQGDAGPTSIYGTEYVYVESDSESTTTSGSYQQKVRLTTGDLPIGNYKLNWSCEVYTTDSDMNLRVQLNDLTTINEIEHTSTDEFDKHFWTMQSGFKNFSSISGINNIDIDYNDDGGGTAKIRRARLEFWRVS